MTRSARGRALARARFSAPAALEGEVLPPLGAAAGAEAFAFGDAEPVLNRRELVDMIECYDNGRWYEPPIPRHALSRAQNASAHHASAIDFKVTQLLRDFIPHPLLDAATFEGLALDWLAMGDFFVERVNNLGGRPLRLRRSLARYTRRGLTEGEFFFVRNYGQAHAFDPGSVLQVMRAGLDQEIYGLPSYLCSLQSAFLNEGATLFRRRYYLNGAHAGFIMYSSEAAMTEDSKAALKEALRGTKGVGNFRNLFVHVPGGKKDGIQLLHPGEAAAKDEFVGIKGVTRDDVLASHRVPPQLLGIIPQTAGGFGDVEKASQVYYENETVPLQQRFKPINDWIGQEVVRFRERAAPTQA